MNRHRYAILAWTALGFTLIVILWGAFVRASGSGAGCGNHWPLCKNGVWSLETLIELTHRLTSGLALVLIVAMFVFAFRLFPRGHIVRRGAALSVLFIGSEALVGAGLVKFEFVAGNASLGRALFMSVHLINTFVLLSVMALTALWASGGSPINLRKRPALAWTFSALLLGTLILGVSGAIAALGDTLFPSASLSDALRQDFGATNFFVRLRLLHPVFAIVDSLALFALSIVIRRSKPDPITRRLTILLPVLLVLQLLSGAANVLLLTPIWMQLIHLALADCIWLVLVLLFAASLAVSEVDVNSKAHRAFSSALTVDV